MSEPIKPGDIDAVIHERARLAIVSALAVAAKLSFGELKEMLGLTDGNLSVHARTLEEAGYIVVEKSFQGRRPHTAMRLNAKGRKAFTRYLDTLQQIVERAKQNEQIAASKVSRSAATIKRQPLVSAKLKPAT